MAEEKKKQDELQEEQLDEISGGITGIPLFKRL